MDNEKKTGYLWIMESERHMEIIRRRPEEIKTGNYVFVKGVAVQVFSGMKTVKLHGEAKEYFTAEDTQGYFLEEVMPADKYILWNYKEYAMTPLGFLPIRPLDSEDKLALLRNILLWYEDTDQETEDFSLEFEVVSRMLLFDDAVIINPRYLQLSDVLEILLDFMGEDERAEYLYARERYFHLFGDTAK